MSILIPNWLIAAVFYLTVGTAAACLYAVVWAWVIRLIRYALANNKAFSAALLFLTFRQWRDDAEAWNFTMISNLGRALAKEDPEKLRDFIRILQDKLPEGEEQ
jgi:hypothetical protein